MFLVMYCFNNDCGYDCDYNDHDCCDDCDYENENVGDDEIYDGLEKNKFERLSLIWRKYYG